MSAGFAGAAVGLVLSIFLYVHLARKDRLHVRELRQYFFNEWGLRESLVGATIFSSSMSLATVVIALLQMGVVFGVGLSWATISFCLGWAAFLVAGPRIRRKAQRRDTIHSFLGRSYGSRRVTVVASTATIAGFLGLFATELFAAEAILKALGFGPLTSLAAIVLFGFVTILYAALGGFRSVVRSDWSQTTLLLLALGTLSILSALYWHEHGSPAILESSQAVSFVLPPSMALSLFFINVPYPFVDTQAWQRIITAQSERAVKRGVAYAIVAFACTWTILIAVAVVMASAIDDGADPFNALIQQAGQLPPVLAFIISFILFPGLFAAMFSSADGFINSAAHCYSLDLSSIRFADDSSIVSVRAQRHVVILGMLGLGLSIALRQAGFGIIDMVFAVSAGQIALFPPVLAALVINDSTLLKRLRPAALTAIISGFTVAWLNGFYSTLSPNSDWWIWTALDAVLVADAYRSPIYAFIVSNFMFLSIAGVAIVALPPKRRPLQ